MVLVTVLCALIIETTRVFSPAHDEYATFPGGIAAESELQLLMHELPFEDLQEVAQKPEQLIKQCLYLGSVNQVSK